MKNKCFSLVSQELVLTGTKKDQQKEKEDACAWKDT